MNKYIKQVCPPITSMQFRIEAYPLYMFGLDTLLEPYTLQDGYILLDLSDDTIDVISAMENAGYTFEEVR